MSRPKKILSEEELKERRRLYNQRYRSTDKGMKKTKESIARYQKNNENYKNYKREYMRTRRANSDE